MSELLDIVPRGTMGTDEQLELIRVVINNRAADSEQRAQLLTLSEVYGIKFKPTTCQSCYLDLAMKIRQKIV